MKYNELTKEEERLLFAKAPKELLQENIPAIMKAALMYAGGVIHHCIIQKISSIHIAAGQASMMKYQVQ